MLVGFLLFSLVQEVNSITRKIIRCSASQKINVNKTNHESKFKSCRKEDFSYNYHHANFISCHDALSFISICYNFI